MLITVLERFVLRFIFAFACVCVVTACSYYGSDKSEKSKGLDEINTGLSKEGGFIHGKFAPDDGRLLMFVGQDSDTLTEYFDNVPEDHVEGITLYSRIISNEIGNGPTESLAGFVGEANWGGGGVDFEKSLNEAPGAALAVGLFLSDVPTCKNTHTRNLVAGDYDDALDRMIDYFSALAPRKVFLRIGFEFDGPWNCYNPETYKAAFRYIHKRIQEKESDNIATVWQSAVWPSPMVGDEYSKTYDHREEGFLDAWYPGDEYVDWMGISVFYRDLSAWSFEPLDTPQDAQERFLQFARAHQKPVFVAEAAPQGYRNGALTKSVIQFNDPQPVMAIDIWDGWYDPFFQFIYDNNDVIRAVAYINTQWEVQQMWFCKEGKVRVAATCGQGNWGDSRVHGNELIKERWLEQVNNADVWTQQVP